MEENKKEIQKPTVVLIEETRRKIGEVITESGLPAFLIAPVMRDLFEEVTNASRIEYERFGLASSNSTMTSNQFFKSTYLICFRIIKTHY